MIAPGDDPLREERERALARFRDPQQSPLAAVARPPERATTHRERSPRRCTFSQALRNPCLSGPFPSGTSASHSARSTCSRAHTSTPSDPVRLLCVRAVFMTAGYPRVPVSTSAGPRENRLSERAHPHERRLSDLVPLS